MINNDIIESVIDWTRPHLDVKIFDKNGDEYIMNDRVVSFIEKVTNEINDKIINVYDYLVKGSILSFQWLDNSDFDLLIEIDDKIDDDEWRRLQDKIDDVYNGMLIPGTEHPLQIYLHRGKYNYDNADGIYKNNEWVKGPYNISVNVDNYMSKFNKIVSAIDINTGELKRDIIDYNIISKLPKEETQAIKQELENKIIEINKDVNKIISQYNHIRDMRHKAFASNMNPAEIITYGSKNKLPHNVIFKLLERYHYLKIMNDLKKISADGISTDEINDISNILGV